jgi:transcriptional regulator with XRE-family HTH domain
MLNRSPVACEVCRMPESFGARLRRQREERQIPLNAIAEQTKIGVTLLQGLEADDVSRWPTGIFRRAFVRAYAGAVGLDPETVVREFLDRHPDPGDTVAIPVDGTAVAIPAIDAAMAPSRLRILVGAAFGSLGRRQSIPSIVSGPPKARDAAPPAPCSVASRVDIAPVDAAIAADPPPPPVAPAWHPDIFAAAELCTEFGRVDDVEALTSLLARAREIVGAAGLIVWMKDSSTNRLWPALAHGYGEPLLAQLTPLRPDDRNATATAFRTAETGIVEGGDTASGAMVVPIVAPGGCVGVLALEFRGGGERHPLVRALATIFAALLAPLVRETRSPAVEQERKLG